MDEEVLVGGRLHGFANDWLLPALQAFESMEPGVGALILTTREPEWWNLRVNLPINVVQFSRAGRGADTVLLELPAIVYSIQGYFEGRGRCVALVDVTDELLASYATDDVVTWFSYLQSTIADGPGTVLMGLDIPRWRAGPQRAVLDLMDLVETG